MDDELMDLALAGSTGEAPAEDEAAEFVGGDAALDEDLETVVGDDPEKKQALYRAIKRCGELHASANAAPAEPDQDDLGGY